MECCKSNKAKGGCSAESCSASTLNSFRGVEEECNVQLCVIVGHADIQGSAKRPWNFKLILICGRIERDSLAHRHVDNNFDRELPMSSCFLSTKTNEVVLKYCCWRECVWRNADAMVILTFTGRILEGGTDVRYPVAKVVEPCCCKADETNQTLWDHRPLSTQPHPKWWNTWQVQLCLYNRAVQQYRTQKYVECQES